MKRHASPTEKINAASRKIPRLSPGQAFAWKARKAAVWLLLSSALIAAPANAQNTAVTYQGRVQVGDTDFSGDGQFKFALVTGTNTAAQATATAVLSGQFVVGYNITFGGSGYVSPPAVTLSGGGGSGATAHAIISDGAVVEIVADTAGSGYTSPPTVTIDPPPPSIVYTTHWSNDGTSVNGSEPAEAVRVPVQNGVFMVALGDTALPNMMALDAAVFEQTGLGLRIWFSDGVNGFAALDPVQPLTPTPYAISALYANALLGTLPASQLTGTLPPGQLSGVYSGPVTFNNANNSFTGTLSGDGSGVTNIQAGALALTSTNLSVVAWGFESLPELSANNVPDEVDNPVQVAAGFAHSLALNANGTVIAWGRGHIYDSGSTADYGQSIVPADLTNAISVAAGFLHSLALRSDGTVVAWGAGKTNGVLPERGQSIVPPGLNDVVAIAGGFLHSLALRSDGTVVAWGAGLVNQPDNGQDFGQSSVPPGLNNVVAISAGQAHSLALKSDGTVVAWGAGGPGGTNGFDVGQSTVPPGLSNVVAIAAGAVHSLALKADGTVVAWGAGFTNDPSTGLHFGQSIVPPGLSNVVAISAGYVHSLALKSDGTVVAWGAETGSFAFGQSDVPPGLNNVAALGSCSMALHSIALRRRSSAPVAWLDSDNTFNGNVTINGHVRISGPAQLGGDLRLNDRNIWFRGGEDTRNGLGWYGAGKVFTFLPGLPEGPVLFGAQGGVLGTAGTNGSQATLVWNEAGNVAIGGLPLPDVRLSLGTDPAPTKITFGGAGLGFSDSQFRLTLPHDGASFTFHAAPIGFERVRIQGNGDVGIGTSAPGARLDVRGDIRLGLFGEYLVPAGVENLKIIRGRLAPDGSVTTGSGFGASRIGTGIYTVSFPTPFTSQPTVTVTVEGASPRLATCANVGTTSVEIRTFDSTTGAAVDEAFHFIAIGPR